MALGTIPNDIRVPLVYIDIDNSQALSGTPAQAQKILVIGQQLSSGTATPLNLERITTSESRWDELYGKGSMMALMLKKLRKANFSTDVYALGVADLVAGAQAKTERTFAATNVKAGVISFLIAGQSVQVAVKDSDTDALIATAVIAAVTAKTNLPVTAALKAASTNIVEFTCKHKGLTGNDLDLRYNYYDGEVLPQGVTITTAEPAFTGGAGTPDMAAIVAAIPDEWYNHVVNPYNDTQSMNDLRDELVERWGPLKMIEGIAYTAFRGTFAESGSYGQARNDFLFSCMGTNAAPDPTWEWAASYAGVASFSLAIDPARPLQTLILPSLLPPKKEVAWDLTERNLLLKDGIATYTITPGGQVAIEREISMYRENIYGDPDPSYLDITTPATLGYLRYSMRTMVTNRYPRHKLANDDVLAQLDPAQPVVTPKLMRLAILDLAQQWVTQGLIEDYDLFAETLEVYRDANDKNRLNCVAHPDIVNQLRIFAALFQFKL
ncbi:phage tail sheath subtilisin-like domain-containing protein [Aliivibrio wodanis]|uniref:phage tail sheath subtilisin-like domain-containing protein n=1 Tax=Aliivibrio wodanis TaxID=80852 RepID=UPI00406C734A